MGEIINDLIDRKNILIAQKAFVQNFNMTECNQKINKITVLIQKITDGGWDL